MTIKLDNENFMKAVPWKCLQAVMSVAEIFCSYNHFAADTTCVDVSKVVASLFICIGLSHGTGRFHLTLLVCFLARVIGQGRYSHLEQPNRIDQSCQENKKNKIAFFFGVMGFKFCEGENMKNKKKIKHALPLKVK